MKFYTETYFTLKNLFTCHMFVKIEIFIIICFLINIFSTSIVSFKTSKCLVHAIYIFTPSEFRFFFFLIFFSITYLAHQLIPSTIIFLKSSFRISFKTCMVVGKIFVRYLSSTLDESLNHCHHLKRSGKR